jgi:hypothetical protein
VFVSNPQQLTQQQIIQQRNLMKEALKLRNPNTAPDVLLAEANQLIKQLPLMYKLGLLP